MYFINFVGHKVNCESYSNEGSILETTSLIKKNINSKSESKLEGETFVLDGI